MQLSRPPTDRAWGNLVGHVLHLIALALLFTLVGHTWLSKGVNWITFQDNTNCFAPILEMLSRKWHATGVPHFSSEFIGGFPFYANPHFNVFYPFYFLWTHAYDTAEHAILFMQKLVLLHLFILCANTYFLGISLRLKKSTSVLIALGFTFSHAIHPTQYFLTITAATAWLPLVLASLCLIFRGYARTGAIALAMSSLLMIGAMPAQVLALTVVVSILFVIGQWSLAGWKRGPEDPAPRSNASAYVALLLAGALVIAVAGPYLLNVRQFHETSIRWAGPHPPIGPGESLSRAILQEDALDLKELSNLLYPTNLYSRAGHIYTGAVVFLLAVAGAVAAVYRRQRSFVILTVIALLFLAFCFRPIVGLINYHIPLINLIREATWFGLIYTLIVFCLAGLGLERLIGRLSRPVSFERMSLLSLAAAVVMAVSFCAIKQDITPDLKLRDLYLNLIALSLLSAPFFAGLISLRVPGPLQSLTLLSGFAIAIYPVDLPRGAALVDNDLYSAESIEVRAVLKHFAETIPDHADFRVDVLRGGRIDWAMNALHFGIRTYQGYLTPQVSEIFTNMYWIPIRPMAARVAGMKYRIRSEASKPSADYWKEIDRYRGWVIEEDSQAFPRVFAARTIAGVYDPKDAQTYWVPVEQSPPSPAAVMLPSTLSPHIQEFLSDKTPTSGASATVDRLTVLSSTDELITVKCEFLTPRIVVLNEFKSKEWQAAIDAKPVDPIEVNHTQIGALAPAGTSVVTFSYVPPAHWALRLLGLGAMILSIVLLQRSAGSSKPAESR